MTFKEQLAKDAPIFMNNDEFGDTHDIKYDGKVYEDVPCTITRPKEVDRNPPIKDHAQGVYMVTNRFHCAADAFGGVIPEQGTKLIVNYSGFWREFYIIKSGDDPGMINLDLEALDE